MLTKRSHIVPIIALSLAFPAAALAATGPEDPTSARPAIANAKAIAPVWPAPNRFRHFVAVEAQRLEIARQRAARKKQEALYANLPGGVSIETLEAIASCESGNNPTAVSSDGSYRGKYQFDYGTWESVGGQGDPAAAPASEQDYRAALLYARSGSSPWPVCG